MFLQAAAHLVMEENGGKPLPISLATKTSPFLHKFDASAKNSFILWTGDGQSLLLQSVQDITALAHLLLTNPPAKFVIGADEKVRTL